MEDLDWTESDFCKTRRVGKPTRQLYGLIPVRWNQ